MGNYKGLIAHCVCVATIKLEQATICIILSLRGGISKQDFEFQYHSTIQGH